MAVHQSIDDFGISLIVKIDYDEAMSKLSSDIGMFLLVIPVILMGVVVAAYFLAKRLLNPITNLTKSAELFTRGQFDTRLAIESNDEIGILAHTFNGMAKSIQDANSKLESRVEERTADLRRSNQDLEQFAYVASHDLQEPLRMVSSYTQLLSRRYTGKLDSDADEFIGFAVDGAKRMQGLINDLLIYSRAGRADGVYEKIDAAEVVGEALRNLGDRLESSNGEVTLGELPNIVADRQQLVSIFQNLLSNSIKYRSVSRDPRINITAERTTKAWKFAIKDNGIGIDSEFTDRIFTIFQRLHGRDEFQSTGIGLAVVKKVVERANGQIWVESEPDEGSTFIFTVIDRALEGDSNQVNEGSDLSVAS